MFWRLCFIWPLGRSRALEKGNITGGGYWKQFGQVKRESTVLVFLIFFCRPPNSQLLKDSLCTTPLDLRLIAHYLFTPKNGLVIASLPTQQVWVWISIIRIFDLCFDIRIFVSGTEVCPGDFSLRKWASQSVWVVTSVFCVFFVTAPGSLFWEIFLPFFCTISCFLPSISFVHSRSLEQIWCAPKIHICFHNFSFIHFLQTWNVSHSSFFSLTNHWFFIF